MYRQAIFLISLRAMSNFVAMLLLWLLADRLAPADLGVYFYCLTICSIICVFSTLGFQTLLLSRHRKSNVVFVSCCFYSLLFSICLAFIFYWLFNKTNIPASQLAAFSAIAVLADMFLFYYQSQSCVWKPIISFSILRVLVILLLVFGWFDASGLNITADSMLLIHFGSFLPFIIFHVVMGRSDWQIRKLIPLSLLARHSGRFYIVNICSLTNGNIIPLIAAQLLSVDQLPYFYIPMKFVLVFSLFVMPINRLLTPYISENRKNRVALQQIATKAFKLLLPISLVVFIVLALLSQTIFSFFPKYDVDLLVVCFLVMLLAQLINAILGPVSWMLTLGGFARISVYIGLINIILVSAVSFALITAFGVLGAMLSFLVSMVFTNLTSYFCVLSKMDVNCLRVA